MTTGYQIKEQSGLHYLIFQVVDWIDIFHEYPEQYLYSSAGNYAEMDSVLEVIKIDKIFKTF